MYALSNKSSWAGYFPPSVLGKTCAAAGLVRGEGQMAPKAPKTPSRGLVAGGRTPLTQHSARAMCSLCWAGGYTRFHGGGDASDERSATICTSGRAQMEEESTKAYPSIHPRMPRCSCKQDGVLPTG